MSTSEHELARRIVQRLDAGLGEIGPDVVARLGLARARALERLQPAPAAELSFPGARGIASLLGQLNPRHLAPIVGMVLTVSAMVYWQQQHRIEDPVEIDAKLLASELPIDALLDKGLDTWLQH